MKAKYIGEGRLTLIHGELYDIRATSACWYEFGIWAQRIDKTTSQHYSYNTIEELFADWEFEE